MQRAPLASLTRVLLLAATLATAACSDDASRTDDVASDTSGADSGCCAAANCSGGLVCNPTTCACEAPDQDTTSSEDSDAADAGDLLATDTADLGHDSASVDTAADLGADSPSDVSTDTGPPPLDLTWPAAAADYKPDIAAFVDQLYVPPPDVDGNVSCCMDFGPISRDYLEDGTNLVDNALGELLADTLAGVLDINGALDMSIQSGGLVLLLDHKLLDGIDDSDGFVLTAMAGRYEGVTNYAVAAAGQGTFTINPEAFQPNSGRPTTVFNPALMKGATMSAGPQPFFLTIPLGGVALNIPLQRTYMAGTAVDLGGANGLEVGYSDGWISGYIYLDDFRDAINAFADAECQCLGLTRPLYGTSASWSPNECMTATQAQTACADPTPNETGCIALATNPTCGVLPFLLDTSADINPDGNGYDAISMGLRFTAVPAEIVGITP